MFSPPHPCLPQFISNPACMFGNTETDSIGAPADVLHGTYRDHTLRSWPQCCRKALPADRHRTGPGRGCCATHAFAYLLMVARPPFPILPFGVKHSISDLCWASFLPLYLTYQDNDRSIQKQREVIVRWGGTLLCRSWAEEGGERAMRSHRCIFPTISTGHRGGAHGPPSTARTLLCVEETGLGMRASKTWAQLARNKPRLSGKAQSVWQSGMCAVARRTSYYF